MTTLKDRPALSLVMTLAIFAGLFIAVTTKSK